MCLWLLLQNIQRWLASSTAVGTNGKEWYETQHAGMKQTETQHHWEESVKVQQRLWHVAAEGHLQVALSGAKHNSVWVAHADTGDQPLLACHLQRRLYRCAALHTTPADTQTIHTEAFGSVMSRTMPSLHIENQPCMWTPACQ